MRRVERRLLWCDTASIGLSSEIIMRTHKHRLTNKRDPLFRGNQWWRTPLVRCETNKGNSKMSNANQSNSNQNFAHQQNGKEQVDTGTASTNTGCASRDSSSIPPPGHIFGRTGLMVGSATSSICKTM